MMPGGESLEAFEVLRQTPRQITLATDNPILRDGDDDGQGHVGFSGDFRGDFRGDILGGIRAQ